MLAGSAEDREHLTGQYGDHELLEDVEFENLLGLNEGDAQRAGAGANGKPRGGMMSEDEIRALTQQKIAQIVKEQREEDVAMAMQVQQQEEDLRLEEEAYNEEKRRAARAARTAMSSPYRRGVAGFAVSAERSETQTNTAFDPNSKWEPSWPEEDDDADADAVAVAAATPTPASPAVPSTSTSVAAEVDKWLAEDDLSNDDFDISTGDISKLVGGAGTNGIHGNANDDVVEDFEDFLDSVQQKIDSRNAGTSPTAPVEENAEAALSEGDLGHDKEVKVARSRVAMTTAPAPSPAAAASGGTGTMGEDQTAAMHAAKGMEALLGM